MLVGGGADDNDMSVGKSEGQRPFAVVNGGGKGVDEIDSRKPGANAAPEPVTTGRMKAARQSGASAETARSEEGVENRTATADARDLTRTAKADTDQGSGRATGRANLGDQLEKSGRSSRGPGRFRREGPYPGIQSD